jgi:hypothetical protein
MNKTIKHKIFLLKQQKSRKHKNKSKQYQNAGLNTNNLDTSENTTNTNIIENTNNLDNTEENSKDNTVDKVLTNTEKENTPDTNITNTNKVPTTVTNEDTTDTHVSDANTNANTPDTNANANTNANTNADKVSTPDTKENTPDNVVNTINNNPFITISSTDTEYPKEYIGYKALKNEDNLNNFINEVEKESNFLNDKNELDIYKLDEQLYKDLKRQNTVINNNDILESFKYLVENTSFGSNLFELQPLANIDFLFKKNLLKTFSKLNVDDNEINAITKIALETLGESYSLYYWGLIPYFDEIININGITDMNLLNNIKLFSQQSTSKTMLDNLMTFITPDNIFYHSIFISGSFSNFGSKANTYIDKINSSLKVNIDITNNTNVIVSNKQYYSIIAPQYEFGIAIINTCMYFDFITNKYYVMWKIERWRNNVIKNYYQMIIDLNNKSQPVSQDLMELMQPLIYNNKVSDSYPLTHVNLLEYYYIILSYQKDDLKQNDITTINNIVNSEIKKNTSDKDISLLIKKEITNIKNTLDINTKLPFTNKDQDQDQDQEKSNNEDQEQAINTNTNVNQDQEQAINTNVNEDQEQPTNEDQDQEKSNNEEKIPLTEQLKEQSTKEQQDEAEMQNDMDKINKAKENLENEYQNYQNDHEQIVNSQPPPSDTDKSITKLATIGSVAALGAIGAGLYFAAPLLLGGKRKKTRKYKHVNNKKKTRSNKK